MVLDSDSDDCSPMEMGRAWLPSRQPSILRAQQLMGGGEAGIWTATRFQPPTDSSRTSLPPDQVFRLRNTNFGTGTQARFFMRRCFEPTISGFRTICIYTDGACLDNGSTVTTPRAGAAFVFREAPGGEIGFALENKGIDGEVYKPTSNRAELRAVIAALKFRHWYGEGYERVVIVTDSEYIGKHAVDWLREWGRRGWRLASGRPVKNKDLWQELSKVMGTYANRGCEVSFWTVPRRFNTVADRVAKAAAERGDRNDHFTKIFGVEC